MASLRQEFVDTIDGELSGDPSRYWVDMRALWGWPLLPCAIALALVPTPSTLGYIIGGAGFVAEVAWIIFLQRRWRMKADRWEPAVRFSDDPSGY